MTDDQSLSLVYSVLLLVLVGSALIAQAIPLGKMLRMAAAWAGIFAVLILVLSFRGEVAEIWARVSNELGIGNSHQLVGDTLELRQQGDGHFWVNAKLNGTDVRFLVDSGATTTSISVATAERAGIDVDRTRFPVQLSTANGTIEAWRARADTLSVGGMTVDDHAVVVSEAFGDFNVLGMNFLSALKSWRVEGRTMILEPYEPGDRAMLIDPRNSDNNLT